MNAQGERRRLPLSAELAQRVVDQVRPVVEHNINIMDDRGVVIASVDPARLGTTHDGAITALDRRDIVRVDRDSAESAVKAGVNIPLVIDGEPVGVIGITGRPAAVEPLARVLVLTVTLLLRQERQLADAQWRDAGLRDLLTVLITDPDVSAARLTSMFRDVGSPLHPPWTVFVALTAADSGRRASMLRDCVAGLDNAVGVDRAGILWFLIGRASGDRTRAVVLDRLSSRGATVIVGRPSATSEELAIDARRLDILTRDVGYTGDDGEVHRLDDLEVEVLVRVEAPEISADRVLRYLGPLTGTLRETAAVVLKQNLSVVASAAALHTHRNTVVQRLNRIEALTGLDLRKFDDAVTMRLALVADVYTTFGSGH